MDEISIVELKLELDKNLKNKVKQALLAKKETCNALEKSFLLP